MMQYARYSAAVAFASIGLALVAFWMRSHDRLDRVSGPTFGGLSELTSFGGALFFTWDRSSNPELAGLFTPGDAGESLFTCYSVNVYPDPDYQGPAANYGFTLSMRPARMAMSIPYWFLTGCSLIIAALLGLKAMKRFTVRGLLIATTIVAVTFGFVVYTT